LKFTLKTMDPHNLNGGHGEGNEISQKHPRDNTFIVGVETGKGEERKGRGGTHQNGSYQVGCWMRETCRMKQGKISKTNSKSKQLPQGKEYGEKKKRLGKGTLLAIKSHTEGGVPPKGLGGGKT